MYFRQLKDNVVHELSCSKGCCNGCDCLLWSKFLSMSFYGERRNGLSDRNKVRFLPYGMGSNSFLVAQRLSCYVTK